MYRDNECSPIIEMKHFCCPCWCQSLFIQSYCWCCCCCF